MKKRLQTLCLMLLAVMAAQAQEEAIAVLTHEGSTKTFSGREALKQAYAEATHGDLITLGSGQFEAVDIEKAITIRGAGLGIDKYGTQPTVIYNNFYIGISDNTSHHFQLEGIFHDGTISYRGNLMNAQFVKCRLKYLYRGQYEETGGTKVYGTCQGMSIVQCKISGGLTCGENSTIRVWNSYVQSANTISEETSNFSMMNCVVYTGSSTHIYGSYLTNCIIYRSGHLYYNDRTTFTNCLIHGFSPDTDKNKYTTFEKLDGVFETFTGAYSESETFALKEDAKALYLGGDGTEVGMYGGVLPYTPVLAGPHISLFSVSPKASSDGKLSVRLQVETTLE